MSRKDINFAKQMQLVFLTFLNKGEGIWPQAISLILFPILLTRKRKVYVINVAFSFKVLTGLYINVMFLLYGLGKNFGTTPLGSPIHGNNILQ